MTNIVGKKTSEYNDIYDDTKLHVPCMIFKPINMLPNILNHIFISKKATKYLSDMIVNENWGKNNILLFKYLDYVWRLQLIDNMVKKFYFKGERRLVFHSGLYTRNTNDDVYICVVPNNINPNKTKYGQKWRVTLGDNGQRYCSFMTKKELSVLYNLSEDEIPVRTTFNENNVTFNPNYKVIINLYDRVRTAKDRILQTLKDDIGLQTDITQSELEILVHNSVSNSILNARINPNICGKQVFIERDLINNKKLTNGYHIELLLPLTLTVNNMNAYFAVVLRINKETNEYEVMSIITREMAYANARLIGYVNINWLKPFANTNKLNHTYLLNNNIYIFNQNSYTINIVNLMAMLHVTLPPLR